MISKLSCRCLINDDTGKPFLIRYFLFEIPRFLGGGACYIHKFVDSDPNRYGPHNHPWNWAFSLILKGRYKELQFKDQNNWKFKDRFPGSVSILNSNTKHVVFLETESPCWTLFIHGNWVKNWGFYNFKTGEYFQPEYGLLSQRNPKRWWIR